MRPIEHPLATNTLAPPVNWDRERQGDCRSLSVCFDREDGRFYSWWKPSWRERLSLVLGVPVRLCIAASSHPPVALQVERN